MKKRTIGGHAITAWAASLVIVGVAAGYAVSGAPSQARSSAEEGGPAVIAAYFHADWCGYCKELSPRYKDLKAKFDTEPVLYVKFDQTKESDRRQSRYHAHALGLGELWEEHGGSTGFIIYLDAETREPITRVNHENDLSEIGSSLQRSVSRASNQG